MKRSSSSNKKKKVVPCTLFPLNSFTSDTSIKLSLCQLFKWQQCLLVCKQCTIILIIDIFFELDDKLYWNLFKRAWYNMNWAETTRTDHELTMEPTMKRPKTDYETSMSRAELFKITMKRMSQVWLMFAFLAVKRSRDKSSENK